MNTGMPSELPNQCGYPNKVYKLWETNYWDNLTGNLVRIYPKQGTETTPYLYVVNDRTNTTTVKLWKEAYSDSGSSIKSAKTPSVISNATTKGYLTQTQKDNTGLNVGGIPESNTVVFYMPFGTDTYIHIIEPPESYTDETVRAMHKFTSFMSYGTDTDNWWASPTVQGTNYTNITNILTPASSSLAITESLVQPTLTSSRYKQLSGKRVYFDISAGWVNLYKTGGTDPAASIMIDRKGVKQTSSPINKNDIAVDSTVYDIPIQDKRPDESPTGTTYPFKPYVIHFTTDYKEFAVVVPFRKTTFIAMIKVDGENNWSVIDFYKFNETGQVLPPEAPQTGSGSGSSGNDASGNDASNDDASGNDASNDDDDDASSDDASGNNTDISGNDDFWKWYWYWKTEGGSDMSSDYILKTQVVPPVCPTCPRCPHGGGACTNCGGQGGSGTVGQAGSTLVGGGITGSVNNAVNTTGNLIGSVGTGITNTATNAVVGGTLLGAGAINTAGGLGGKVLDSGTGLARDTLGLAKDAVSGTAGLARDAVSGTVGLAKDTVSGTVGLAKDVVSGTTGLLSNQQGSYSQGSQGSQNQQTNINSYSYNGTLPSRGSTNFMPVTADFSRFGR